MQVGTDDGEDNTKDVGADLDLPFEIAVNDASGDADDGEDNTKDVGANVDATVGEGDGGDCEEGADEDRGGGVGG
jgi:hypothetical protein